MTERQEFYKPSPSIQITLENVIRGRIIKISPAIVTVTDAVIGVFPPEFIQKKVYDQVTELLTANVKSFHCDINFADYSGFGHNRPIINTNIFTPRFLEILNDTIRSNNGFLTLHLITDNPQHAFEEYKHIRIGAVCFQLEIMKNLGQLEDFIDQLLSIGVCISPVIETIGSENLLPMSEEEYLTFLEPFLHKIGMLTFQAASTASRSNISVGNFAKERVT
ncbi:MAG: hypothetical protein ACW98A_14925 [Candidatus Hodarchaeales archaeon]|jgi:hypothetical protein